MSDRDLPDSGIRAFSSADATTELPGRRARSALSVLAACAVVVVGRPVIVTAANVDLCHDEWQSLQSLPDPLTRIHKWSELRTKCSGSGLYEARLGTLYVLSGRYDDARTTVKAGLSLGTRYEKDLLSVSANADMGQGKLDSASLTYQSLIQKFPDYYDGYAGAGAVKLLQGQLDDAVKYLHEGEQHGGAHFLPIYRNLTLAYQGLRRYADAVAAWNQAYTVDKSIVKDREAMHAAAISYVYLGKLHAADGALKMLFQADPEAAQDPQIHKTMTYIAGKLAEEQSGGPPKN